MTGEQYDLARFIEAQEGVIERAKSELAAGRKCSHWMWFIFPQIVGLGRNAMAERYAISSLAEAGAYAAHPVLGQRLRDCTAAVLATQGRSAHEIFGSPDDLKFCSSMTLFARACPQEPLFRRALTVFFEGQEDLQTAKRLG